MTDPLALFTGDLMRTRHQREEDIFLNKLRAMFSLEAAPPGAALPAAALHTALPTVDVNPPATKSEAASTKVPGCFFIIIFGAT